MDLRVSAKDLIGNHLTMALYNHAAVWKDRPEMWPRRYDCNGGRAVRLLDERRRPRARATSSSRSPRA